MSVHKEFDDSYRVNKDDLIAGFDEAGRGPICGPVVAAGVILKPDFDADIINDSKKMTPKQRDLAYDLIIKEALFYHISIVSSQTIDQINILEASRLGMQQALDDMINHNIKPNYLLTDYMKLNNTYDIKLDALKKGDAKSLNIGAASILAKVTRDRIMEELDKKYPQYELKKHKGYPTKRHLELIQEYGIKEDIYRLTFGPVKKIIEK
jgi:ribonuclease HII